MRLLITTDTVGGVWSYTKTLVTGLLERGVSVALVTVGPAPSATQAAWLSQAAAVWGAAFYWRVSLAPLEWMTENKLAYLDAEALLLSVAREFGADLLHSSQYCFGALPLALPKLIVAHSDVLSWAAACRREPLASSAWLNQYYALVATGLQQADAVVAPTRWMLSALCANFVPPHTACVIPNGCTLPGTPELGRKLQAVSAGRVWDEAKNLGVLEQVDLPLPVLVAGETAYESQTLPAVGGHISLLGQMEEAALWSVFRESAIYLCTSQYEPFGLAPLEAALCGCAVLAYDIPSLREVWGDAAEYFQDMQSLSALLCRLTSQPASLAAAQVRSRRRANQYSAASMVDQYLVLYREMLTRAEGAAYVA